jgi:hypothetical protein
MQAYNALNRPNVHEMLKQQVSVIDCPKTPMKTGISDQYITLDSFVKLEDSNTDRGEFKWNFVVQGSTTDDAMGVNSTIDNVIQIQIGAFSMPMLPEVPYVLNPAPAAPTGTDQLVLVHNNVNGAAPFSPILVPNVPPFGQYPGQILIPPNIFATGWMNNPYSQTPFFDRLSIQFKEASSQSISARHGARHHFEFVMSAGESGANPNMMLAKPLSQNNWDTYTFTEPIRDFHGLTLVFRNPDNPIRFLPDCLYNVSIESDLSAAPGPFLRINAPGHNLNAGDRFFVEDFRSGNYKLDNYVNRPEGHVASGDPAQPPLAPGVPIVLANPNVFYFDPAISIIDLTVQLPVLPSSATINIAKRRLLIPVRFRKLVFGTTNYITPQ